MDRENVLRDILRVNHAGEYGAIRIYRAQAALCRDPAIRAFVRGTVEDESRHLRTFRDLMRHRAVQPCGALPIWGIGGTVLGGLTGLAGPRGVLLCTIAVERCVHAHLQDQVRWLITGPEAVAIAGIMAEEAAHADDAQARLGPLARMDTIWLRLIAVITFAMIWASTYGAAARMRRVLRQDGLAPWQRPPPPPK